MFTCRPCGEWGQKDHGTVKVDMAALQAMGKENASHPNIMNGAGGKATGKELQEAQEKARQRQEWEAKQEELRRQEEQRREMERRIQEEQERQQAELRRREAERRRLQLEQEAREAEERERQRRQREEQMRKQQEQERQLEEQRLQEAERKRLSEIENGKKVHAWLQANGFKGLNDPVRKRFSKVTPLHFVIQQNDVEMLKLLLQNGADASKINAKNESALTVAQKVNKKESHAAAIQVLQTYFKLKSDPGYSK